MRHEWVGRSSGLIAIWSELSAEQSGLAVQTPWIERPGGIGVQGFTDF